MQPVSDRPGIILLPGPAIPVIGALCPGGLAIGLMRSFNDMPVIGAPPARP